MGFMPGVHAPRVFCGIPCLPGVATHCTYLTLGLSVFLGYVAVFSFGADYWYTGDKPTADETKVSECLKQFVCNAIDRSNVPIIAIIQITIGLVQFFCAPTMNWAYPAITLVFGCAIGAQQVGV